MINTLIKDKIENKLGRKITTPNDCNILVLDIEQKTGEHIGLNTLKRMFGFIGESVQSRQSTQEVLAKYLGYSNWRALNLVVANEGNSDFDICQCIISDNLAPDAIISFTYAPNRKVELRHLSDNRFIATYAEHSKILKGDILTAQQFVIGQPLICTIVRNEENIGRLTAGKQGGLTSLTCK